MYISGGFDIYPREVEIAIETHPDVGLVAVLGVPDEAFGEVGHAFVEPKPGASLDAAELDEWCRERLANYKTPKRFEVRTELPRLPIGKIDKQALKQELAGRSGWRLLREPRSGASVPLRRAGGNDRVMGRSLKSPLWFERIPGARASRLQWAEGPRLLKRAGRPRSREPRYGDPAVSAPRPSCPPLPRRPPAAPRAPPPRSCARG